MSTIKLSEIIGTVFIGAQGHQGVQGAAGAQGASGTITNTAYYSSDRRLKENIRNIMKQ